MGKWNYGVLTARNPTVVAVLPGGPLERSDARQTPELKLQPPPRGKRYEPVVGPVGLVTLPDE